MPVANFTVNSFALIFDRLITDGTAAVRSAPERIHNGETYADAFRAASRANDNRRAAEEFLGLIFPVGTRGALVQPHTIKLEALRIMCRDLDKKVERYAKANLR